MTRSVDTFLDVNVLLTLTLRLSRFLSACEKFRQDAKRENMDLHMTSSVQNVFDYKISESNDMIGELLRGLVISVSTMRTGGQDQLLETIVLTASDRSVIRGYFQKELGKATTELRQIRIKAVEAWVVNRFEEAVRKSSGVSLIDFAKAMILDNQDAYDKIAADRSILLNELKISVVPINPSDATKTAIRSAGVNDPEDIMHLASVCDYLAQSKSCEFAVYVTTDYTDVLSAKDKLQKLKIVAEEPTYAVHTYMTLRRGEMP